MKSSKILVIISVLICWFNFSKAQNSLLTKADYPNPLQPSPEAAALGKYGDVPVSLFSGLAQTNIPIYNFKAGDINVPVDLSYHAGGIRVDDIATNVGLGWALNAGGVITKVVQGIPDGYYDADVPSDNFNPNTNYYPNQSFTADYEFAKFVVANNADLERDIYYYNFLNNSGKFIINRNGEVCLYPANPNIKIQFIETSSAKYFIITDDKGFKYYFDIAEGFQNLPSVCSLGADSPLPYYSESGISAYYLTKIISAKKQQVTFEYEIYNYTIAKSYQELEYKQVNLDNCDDLTPQNRKCTQIQTINGLRIKKIKYENHSDEILFNYSSQNRLDLKYNNQDQGNYLENIEIKQNSNLIKKWYLTYGYFGSLTNLRLKLLSVRDDTNPAYEFTYNETYPLPERLSFSQDYWGFYNGKSNSTFIPSIPEIGRLTGADRSPDALYMTSGSLSRIKYPTGGYTDFIYEPHLKLVSENVTNYVEESAYLINVYNSYTDFFLPEGALEIALGWDLPTINYDEEMRAEINGGTNFSTNYELVIGSGSKVITPGGNNGMVLGATYRLSIYSPNPYDLGNVSLTWKKPVTTNQTYEKILYGGLRIKTINSFDGDGSPLLNKNYTYNWVNNPTVSSMILPHSADNYNSFFSNYEKPKFWISYISYTSLGPLVEYLNFDGYCNYQVLSSSTPPVFGAALDNAIGYEQVIETDNLSGINGRSIFKYANGSTIGYKGLMIENHLFKYNNLLSNFSEVKKIKNSYLVSPYNQDTIPHLKISYLSPEIELGLADGSNTVAAKFYVEKYWTISARIDLKKTQEITYSTTSLDSIIKTTDYNYASTLHNYPTSVEVDDSKSIIKTENKYVTDIVNAGGAPAVYQEMLDDNIISPLIEQKMTNLTSSTELSFKKTNYNSWYDIYLPASIQTSYLGNPLETELTFSNYNADGNILTYSKRNLINTSYRWGYNNQYPIAEVNNSSTEEFYTENFEEGVIVTIGTAHTGKRYYTGTYLLNFALPNGKNYVYSYWYKSGGIWVYSGELPYTTALNINNGDIDDVRVYPTDAQMTTYTYDPLVGITSMTDASGRSTYYEYDSQLRLANVKDQDGHLLKHNNYHYKNQ